MAGFVDPFASGFKDPFEESEGGGPGLWGVAKQLPLGVARGAAEVLESGSYQKPTTEVPEFLQNTLKKSPHLSELYQRGQQLPTAEEVAQQKQQGLEALGVNSPENMPKGLFEKMASGAGESVPWSLTMGPHGALGNIGLGMVGGAGGEAAKEMYGAKTPDEKAWVGLAGNVVSQLGTAGAIGLLRGLYNWFAPYRRLPGEFDLPVTRGMLEPENSAARPGMLAEEQAMERGARGPLASREMQRQRAARSDQVAATRFNDPEFLAGAETSPRDAGAVVMGRTQARAADLEDEGNQFFAQMRLKNPWAVADEHRPELAVDDALTGAGFNLDSFGNYIGASRARRLIERLGRGSAADDIGGWTGGGGGAENDLGSRVVSLNEMYQLQKGLNKIRATNSEDSAALSIIKDSYNRWVHKTIDGALFSGDRSAIQDLDNAKRIWSEMLNLRGEGYAQKGQDYARFLSGIFDEGRTPEEVGNWLINVSSLEGSAKAARFATFLQNTFGSGSDVWQTVKQAALSKAFLTETPEKNGLQLANSIRNFLDGKGAPLANALFTPAELERMREFGTAIRRSNPPLANPSGSAHELGRTLWHAASVGAGAIALAADAHIAPLRWMAFGSIPILAMMNNARKARHATRETLTGPGASGALGRAGVGAMGELNAEGVP